MFEGRSDETKRACLRRLMADVPAATGISVNDLEIVILESPKANWGIRGEAAPQGELGTLKDFARRALGPADLVPASVFDFSDAPAEIAVFGPVAWSAIDLLAKGELERVKQCPGPDCGWLFLDQSKNNSRRWCDMTTCGNRMKGRRHRQRR